MDHAALFHRLRTQVEFYFSPHNLSRDTYLRSMLTNTDAPDEVSPRPMQLMTPTSNILNFPKVKNIMSGAESMPESLHMVLKIALEGSAVVTMSTDGQWIGPASQNLPPMGMAMPQYNPQQGQMVPNMPGMNQMFPQHMYPPGPMMTQPGSMMMIPVPPGQEMSPHPGMPVTTVPYNTNIPNEIESPTVSTENEIQQAVQLQQIDLSSTVALLELPSDINPLEILTTFTTDTLRPKGASLQESESIWIVVFGSEDDANSAIEIAKTKTLRGKPIKALLRSEMPKNELSVQPNAASPAMSSLSGGTVPTQQPQPTLPQQPHPMYPPPPNMMQGQPGVPPQGALPYPPPNYGRIPAGGMPPHLPQGPPGTMPPPYYYNQMYPGYHPGMPPPPQHATGMLPPQRFGMPPAMSPRYPPQYPYQGGMHQGYMEYGHQHQNGGYQPRFNRMNSGGSHQSNYSQGGNNNSHNNQQQDGIDKKKKKKRNQQNNKDFNRRNSHDGIGSNIAAGRRQEFGNNSIITNGNGQNQFRRNLGASERHESVNTNNISNVNGTPNQTRRDGVSPNSRRSSSNKSKGDQNKTNATELQRDASFTKQDFPELGNKDFPDLAGKKDATSGASTPAGTTETPPKSGTSVDEKKLVGYASALLKKNPSPAPTDHHASITSATSQLSAGESEEARQTYEMEREILSEFHDLSMHDADEHDVTADAIFVDNVAAKEDNYGAESSEEGLPILPDTLPSPKKNDRSLDSSDSDPPLSSKDTGTIQPIPDGESNDQYTGESEQTVADPKPNGAWGKKLMFSDVSSLSSTIFRPVYDLHFFEDCKTLISRGSDMQNHYFLEKCMSTQTRHLDLWDIKYYCSSHCSFVCSRLY